MGRSKRRLALVWAAAVVVLVSAPSCWSQEDDPFKANPTAKPLKEAFGSDEGFGAAAGGDLRIPLQSNSAIAFGPLGCPVVVVDGKVWGVKDGRLLQTLDVEHRDNHTAVLSDDGKWFAYGRESNNSENNPIAIFSTETGEEVFEVPGQVGRYTDFVAFSLNKYLLLGGRSSTDIQVWDFQAGKMIKLIETAGNAGPKIEKGKIAFTTDGKYYAVTSGGELGVCKTTTGKPVVIMSPPSQMDRNGERPAAAVATTIRPRNPRLRTGIQSGTDSTFVYAWLQAMKFSPDNKELAAISTHPVPRLMCWDNRGKIIMDDKLDLPPGIAFWNHSIQWLPDNSGWLVTGHLYDRSTRRIVLGFRSEFGSKNHVWVMDKDHLLGAYGRNAGALEVIQIPWSDIHNSLKALADKAPAHLAPGQAVSLQMQLTGLGGDQAETMRLITEAFIRRLERDGLTLASGQKTVFRVRFSEAAGDTLPIYERQSPFDFRGHDTGRTATERKGNMVLEMIVEGEPQPLWRDTISASSSRSFREDINDSTIRQSMLDSLTYRIGELNIPYFIPKSPDLYALPIVVE